MIKPVKEQYGSFGQMHEKCAEGVRCTGPGCKRVTGKTARKRRQ